MRRRRGGALRRRRGGALRMMAGRIRKRRGGRLRGKRGGGWFTDTLGKLWKWGKKGYAAYKSSPLAQKVVKKGLSMAKNKVIGKLDAYEKANAAKNAMNTNETGQGYRRRRRGRGYRRKRYGRGIPVNTLAGPLP